jgi:hypothetical protein
MDVPSPEVSMSKQKQEWTKLCSEHAAAKKAHDEAFAVIVAGVTAHIDGKVPSAPGLEQLEYEERARKQLEEIRARMQEFVGANTWPV